MNLGEDNESCYGDELEDKAGEFYPAEFAGGALPYNEKLEIAFEYTTSSENPEVVTPKDAGEYLMRYLKYRAINSDGTALQKVAVLIVVYDGGYGKILVRGKPLAAYIAMIADFNGVSYLKSVNYVRQTLGGYGDFPLRNYKLAALVYLRRVESGYKQIRFQRELRRG